MTASKGTDWLGVADVARELDVTMRDVYRLIDKGVLPGYRLGRDIRIRRADLDAYQSTLQRAETG